MGATTEGIAVGSAASEPHAANPQQKRGLELAAGAIIVVGFVLLVAVAIEIGGAVQLFRARRSWLPLGAGLVGLAIAGLLAAFQLVTRDDPHDLPPVGWVLAGLDAVIGSVAIVALVLRGRAQRRST
jgi:hypothetical protein